MTSVSHNVSVVVFHDGVHCSLDSRFSTCASPRFSFPYTFNHRYYPTLAISAFILLDTDTIHIVQITVVSHLSIRYTNLC